MRNSQTFKVGDQVYYPSKSTKIFTLKEYNAASFPLVINTRTINVTFTVDGREFENSPTPLILHATEENRVKLSGLYGVEFEEVKSKTVADIVKDMFSSGKWKLITYRTVGNTWATLREPPGTKVISESEFNEYDFNNPYIRQGSYFVEILDPCTGKVIVDFVDNEIVLDL